MPSNLGPLCLRRCLRLAALAVTTVILAGCSHVHPTQSPDKVLVRAGPIDEFKDAAPFADAFVTYALIADQTYADGAYASKHYLLGDRTYCYPYGKPGCLDVTPHARALLDRWRIVYAHMDAQAFPCTPGRVPCTKPLPGLGVQVWVRKGQVCREAVIAFRGTDGQSADDWISNLRWITRLLPIYDQYEQVQDHTPDFIKAVEDDPCFRRGQTAIVTVGHSLGGGLAQQASYMDRRIRHVFAIDPSFVTGSSDLHVQEHYLENVRGLAIDRIYEHGEVLAYLRYIQRQLAPPSECNPAVRLIRFEALHGNLIEQHKLAGLTTALLQWSRTTRPQKPLSELPSLHCSSTTIAGAS